MPRENGSSRDHGAAQRNLISWMRASLFGEDGNGGKQKERDDLRNQLVEDVRTVKKNLDDLSDAFSGLNNSKKNFCTRYLTEADSNR